MKLVRFRIGDRIATGAVTDEGVVQVLAGTFFEAPVPTGEEIPLDDVRLLAPVLPSKVVGIGLNYASHAAELGGRELPAEPLAFLKPSTSVIGPEDPIPLLTGISERIDYEGELAVVIGRMVRHAQDPDEAERAILGYTCANDVTLRDKQKTDNQWTRAKGFDGSCPLGPWIETGVDPHDLGIETRVNGEVKQSQRTSDLVFSPVTLVSWLTQFMTLLPGDVILTGTPAGIGPLTDGDRVEVEIENIGTLRNTAVNS